MRNAAGVGVPRPKDAISEMEENILWEKGILGFKDPNTLHNTVLFMVGIHFGLRAGQGHRALRRYPKCQIERDVCDGNDWCTMKNTQKITKEVYIANFIKNQRLCMLSVVAMNLTALYIF